MPVFNPSSAPIVVRCSATLIEHSGTTDETVIATVTVPAGLIENGDVVSLNYTVGMVEPYTSGAYSQLYVNGRPSWPIGDFNGTIDSFSADYRMYVDSISTEGGDGLQHEVGATSNNFGGYGGFAGSSYVITDDLRNDLVFEIKGALADANDTMQLLGSVLTVFKNT